MGVREKGLPAAGLAFKCQELSRVFCVGVRSGPARPSEGLRQEQVWTAGSQDHIDTCVGVASVGSGCCWRCCPSWPLHTGPLQTSGHVVLPSGWFCPDISGLPLA